MTLGAAMMASRITLLLLASGMFAGMWSTDRSDERTEAEALLACKASSSRVASSLTGRPTQSRIREASASHRSMKAASIPLPDGIATGTYLIVDELGRTQNRTVTAHEAFPKGLIHGHVAAEHYTVRDGQHRWHFIRLDVPVELTTIRAAHSARAATLQ